MLSAAVKNNASWYSAVTSAHGIANEIAPHFWYADAETPPYYSNLVTRTNTEEGRAAQLEQLRAFAAEPPQSGWGFKDSFACLPAEELQAIGMRSLFDAQWYGLAPSHDDDREFETGCRFEALETSGELARWEKAWQLSSPASGMRVFPPALLEDTDITFCMAMRGAEPIGGMITNLSERAVGISNVFQLKDNGNASFLRDCARMARRRHRSRAVVGYGRESDLRELTPLGFAVLGPLRVWVSDA